MADSVSPHAGFDQYANVPRDLIDALNAARWPVVVGHVGPDVDALGAMLALARAMPAPESAVTFAKPPGAAKLRFLLELADCRVADDEQLRRADVLAVLDTATTKRVNVPGDWDAIADKLVVNIDHHISNTDFGRINWVVDNASSTCELIYRLISAAGWPLDKTSASLLFAGIYTDTCGFSLPSASAETFETVAALLRAGADIEKIGLQLGRSRAPHEFELIRIVYRNTQLAGDGQIAYSTLTLDEIRAAGCTPADIDEQVSIPRSLSGIRIAMLLSEMEPGLVRINLRGEDGTPVLPLAEALGGGGHTCAAGVRVRGTMNQVRQRILNETRRYLGQLQAGECA